MEIKVNLETLRKRGLFLACPMYGGQCAGMFTKSIADLSAICTKNGIPLQLYFLFNESLITRARSYCVDEFLRSESQHMMFIDSDIGFNPHDVIALMALQANDAENKDYHIIGGAYPKKCLSWEKIKHAVDKGVADKDPTVLEKYVGDFVFNPKHNQKSIQIGEPCEVLEIGTGFMMISRYALEHFRDSYPQYMYKPDHARTEAFDGSREILQAFQAEIDPKSKRYLSEDYWFCQKAQEIGLKVWLCPWMKLQHVGAHIFGGSLADIAALGISPTVEISMLKKKSK